MKCHQCEKEIFLPFRCAYCGGYFCSEHRLPENHECPRMELARAPKIETRPTIVQKQKPHEYTLTPRRKIHFTNRETKHLAIAALLVIGIGLSLEYPWTLLGFQSIFLNDYVMLTTFTIILAASFFIHEIAHKIAAQRMGFWAEFRLVSTGAILTLISIILPFKIISPGAVMVSGYVNRKSMGKISIAGPLTNIILSTILLIVAFPFRITALILGSVFNAWIALFNLIPSGRLDGLKIFRWNKTAWALTFATSLILTIISYIYSPFI
ncbi:hypothetical protein KAT21_04620 [Candidatus Bathyarchaeota archaeon]|nr:hypothetical protein [Candidatus Bathyarchaeota archaeon]